MKRCVGFSKYVMLTVLLGLGFYSMRPQEFEVTATSGRTYTSPSLPSGYADGFDFPVGGGNATGYYTARRMVPYQHMGDDWNGNGGGNSDYGDPVLAIAHGKVVYSQNYGSDWGEVVIVRHKYRDSGGSTKYVDSLYGHVINRRVSVGQSVRRGQRIASIGNNRGMYVAHLHLEIRKNINIGIRAWAYPKSYANYHQPTTFINSHRPGKIKSPSPSLRIAKSTTKKPSQPKKEEPPMLFPLPKPDIVKAPSALLAKLQSKPSSSSPKKSTASSPAKPQGRSQSLGTALGFNRSSTSMTAKTSPAKSGSSQTTTAQIRTTISSKSSKPRLFSSSTSQKPERNGLLRSVFSKDAKVERTSVKERRVTVSHFRSSKTKSVSSPASSKTSKSGGFLKKAFSKKKK